MNEHIEILISRLAGDEAGPDGWREFSELATVQPQLWHDLAIAQRDQVALVQMVADAGEVAAHVDLPAAAPVLRSTTPTRRPFALLPAVTGWAGWAVAAAIAAAVIVSGGPTTPTPSLDQPAVTPVSSVDDAFQAYLRAGRETGQVLGEMPTKVLIETRPGPLGEGFEVLYMRGVLERATVPDLYRFERQTEQGRPALVRWDELPSQAM